MRKCTLSPKPIKTMPHASRQEVQIKITVRKKFPPTQWAKYKRVWTHQILCSGEADTSYTVRGEGVWTGMAFSGSQSLTWQSHSQVCPVGIKTPIFTCTRIFILTCFCNSKKFKDTYMFDNRERSEQIVVCSICPMQCLTSINKDVLGYMY